MSRWFRLTAGLLAVVSSCAQAVAAPTQKRVLIVTTDANQIPLISNFCNGTYVVTDLTAAGYPFDVVNYDKFLTAPLDNHDVIILNGHPSPHPVSSVQAKLQTALQEGRKVFVNSEFCYCRYNESGVLQEYLRYPLSLFNVSAGTTGAVSGIPVVPTAIEKDPAITNAYWQNYSVKDFAFGSQPAMKIALGGKTLGFLYPNGGCMEGSKDFFYNLIDYGKLVSYLRYGTSSVVGFANDRIDGRPIASFEVHFEGSSDSGRIDDVSQFASAHNVPLANLLVWSRVNTVGIAKWNSVTNPLMTIGSHSRTHPSYWPPIPDVLYETRDALNEQRLVIPATGNYFNWSGNMNPSTAQIDAIYQSGVIYSGKGYDRRGYSLQSGQYVDVQRIPTALEWFYNNAACAIAPYCLSYTVVADWPIYTGGSYYLDEIATYFPRNVKYGMYTFGQLHDSNLTPSSGQQTHGILMSTQIGWAMDYLNSKSAYFVPTDELMLRLRDYLAGWIDYEGIADGGLRVTVCRPGAKANQVKIQGREGLLPAAVGSSVISQHVRGRFLYVDLAAETTSTFDVQFVSVPVASIASAVAQPDGAHVTIAGIVTAVYQDCCYIEQTDRVRGIKLIGSFVASEGEHLAVKGTTKTVNGERVVEVD